MQIIPPMKIESYHFKPNSNTKRFDSRSPKILPALDGDVQKIMKKLPFWAYTSLPNKEVIIGRDVSCINPKSTTATVITNLNKS